MAVYLPLATQESHALDDIDLPTTDPNLEKRPRGRFDWKKHLIAALPQFARPGGLPHRNLGPTAYLDALRGYAAIVVYNSHVFNSHDAGWRIQPFIKTFFQGAGMVSLFFVISGYVLGYRLLIHMRNKEPERLMNALASSTFRRYIRLFGSTGCACLISLILVRLHVWTGWRPPLYIDSFGAQLLDFFTDFFLFCNPFAHISGWVDNSLHTTKYLGQMWSIAAEYRGSVALFAFCTGVCKLSTQKRMILTLAVIVPCYLWQSVYIGEFLQGLFIADLSLSRHPERLLAIPRGAASHQDHTVLPLKSKIGYSCLFVVGWLLLGEPDGNQLGIWGPFPWTYIKPWFPWWWDYSGNYLIWLGLGAFAMILALDSYPTLQAPLKWRFSQYVGDLSFGIYAMHPLIGMSTFGQGVSALRESLLGHSYPAYIPEVLIYYLACFIAADYFVRIDKIIIRSARWLQTKAFHEWNE